MNANFFASAASSAPTRNIIAGRTNFAALAHLSVGLTNPCGSTPVKFKDGLVYVATKSIGGRWWYAAEPIDRIEDKGFGEWLGHKEAGAYHFKWESASSLAMLEAMWHMGEWRLTFTGAGPAYIARRDGYESAYFSFFADAVDPASLEVLQRGDVGALERRFVPLRFPLEEISNPRERELVRVLRQKIR